MSTERELLTLAAKACGLKHKSTDELSQWLLVEGVRTPLLAKHCWYWNPLTDDGDCARMEAQLGIDVKWYKSGVIAHIRDTGIQSEVFFINHASDKNAARRAASVAIAVEIWRLM